LLFIVSGPGGVGKDTVVRRVLAREPSLSLSRSWTTRPRRPSETDADYNFVTRDEFLAEIERDGFLEWAEYLGHFYGTPRQQVAGGDVVLVIEVQGAAQVLEKEPGAVMILIEPPSRAALAERMRARGDSEERIADRLAAAQAEIEIGRSLAHEVVVNDDVERAAAEVAAIIQRSRTTP
jgi:guanylate kinase